MLHFNESLGTASVFFFHIRRFDGVLERDDLGLDLAETDLVREADAGASGLLIESIAEGTDASYERFEIADTAGRTVLTFDFALVLRTIRCAQRHDLTPIHQYQAKLPDSVSLQIVRSS